MKKSHGMSKLRVYKTWESMKARCFNSHNVRYSRYGGRGIIVCQEWKDSFIAFKAWADVSGYTETLQIDRIDNNGNYCPENCRWVTHTQNNRNRNDVKLTESKAKEIRELYKTGNYSHRELAKIFNVGKTTIGSVLNNTAWKEHDN